uniref:Pectate lyase n=1 Tax=Nonomuraea gerenzanensis TaxID=93944 RepID=A0A1M4E594_9ACTN|nr:Pectate lyase precursor [Nonomuraea gerenzanensis]
MSTARRVLTLVTSLAAAAAGLTAATAAPAAADTPLVGWATQGGGTTGGGSAATTTVSSASALTSALSSGSAAVIRVSGTISCSGMLRVASNKTVIGNSGATISGCGFNVSQASNVIIRNLTFRNWGDDGINVQYSTRVYIDHNTFSNGGARLVGWATQGGGTTGGGSAATTTVSSASALTSALSSGSAAVIRVSGTISCSGMLRVASNKTVIGNSGATISGCGFNVSQASNVIIRNLTFRNWGDDGINVQYSTRVYIDHNTFSNGGDGALDIKRSSDYITVSWNRFFDHDKTMLLGHSDSNASEDRGRLRVTYHHNWFDGTNQRHPRVRFGNPVHVFNNYYGSVGSYGVASTMEGGVLVEGNYFENTDDPFHLGEGSSPAGTLVARNNHFVNSGSGQSGGSVRSIPYSYSLDSASSVKSIVTAGAGAGRISL